MRFTREFLLDDAIEHEVSDTIVDRSRWAIIYRRIFKFQDKFYETIYSLGATEYQEAGPYEYEVGEDGIECAEVFPEEITITVYKKKKN